MSVYHNGQKVLNNITSVNEEAMKEIAKEVYSTEEQVVGTWIDGKPIYEKVIKQTVVINSQNTSFNIDIPKFDFIMYYVDMVRPSSNEHLHLNFNHYDSNYGLGGFLNYINNSTINFRVGSLVVGRTYHLTMIFRYTKAD